MEKCPSVSQWAGEWAGLPAAADQAVSPRLEGNLHFKMSQPSLYHHILALQEDRSPAASHCDHNFPTSHLIFSIHTSEVSQRHPVIKFWGLKHKSFPFAMA